MSDPLEQLDRFRSEMPDPSGAPMLSAAEVRRQGDRMRRRGTALRAGVAALAIVAVALPITLAADRDDHPIDPSTTFHGVGEINVLTDADTVAVNNSTHWSHTIDRIDNGNIADGICTAQGLDALGATTMFRRDWALDDASGPVTDGTTADELSETVGAYDSPAAARAAVEQIAAGIATCNTPMPPARHYTADRPQNIDTGDPSDMAMLIESRYVPSGSGGNGRLMETGLIASGDRVAVVTMTVGGQDLNLSPTPVEQMMATAAERLVATRTDTQPSPSGSGSSLDASILVGEDDVDYMRGASWHASYTGPSDVQAPFSTCASKPLVDIGATSTVQRSFVAGADEGGDGLDAYLVEAIGEFGSASAAARAATTLEGFYTDCSPTGATHYDTISPWADVPTGTSATATQMIARYGPADAQPGSSYDVSGRTDFSWYLDVSIIVDGTRVAVLVQNALMVDYDTTAVTTTAQDVPVAANRLDPENLGRGATSRRPKAST